jgi:hypothetical protein
MGVISVVDNTLKSTCNSILKKRLWTFWRAKMMHVTANELKKKGGISPG